VAVAQAGPVTYGRLGRRRLDRLDRLDRIACSDHPGAVLRRIGVDTGGTFTDIVTATGEILKLLSTPEDPAAAVLAGVEQAGAAESLAHGTTVATNTLLERRGGRVALFTTAGHTDVIEIARQVRPALYDPFADRPEPLVARGRRYDVPGRLAADGSEIEPVGEFELPEDIDAAAIVLLHADRNPAHEKEVAERLRAAGIDVTASHQVSPEFREYERTVTTAANAYLRPPCRAYLLRLAETGVVSEVLVMTSAGGLIPVAEAAERPVALLLSGPAGGVLAASQAALAAGFPDAITFDMGGTSTDVCLIRNGRPEPAAQREVAGLPMRMPSLDVHTIGAGGGSIARIDPGGALVVGPESAGAVPGPACYGRGGTAATVTDANVVAGRIPGDGEFAGLGRLDGDAAQRAMAAAGVDADGVIAVVDANMVRALRRVSVERGVDPRGLALVAFGGAGPLHACALADALGMAAVVVPPRAGVLSAAGMLAAPRQVDLVRSWPRPDDHEGAEDAAGELAAEARRHLAAPGSAAASAAPGSAAASAAPDAAPAPRPPIEVATLYDCRYAGQSHEISVTSISGFGAEHQRRNGFARPDARVEVVALRASARLPSPVALADLPDPGGRSGVVKGPNVITEPDCTIWVAEGWSAQVGGGGAWVLTRTA
jgi:N-methylhydantoinase A/oxoprolinase/acetone carboxylase beta subunit